MLQLAWQPELDSNPLAIHWREAGAQSPLERATRSGKGPLDYKQLVVSGLRKHPQPDESWQSCGNWEPIKQKDLLSNLKLPEKYKGRISEVIKALFGSQTQYAHLCRRQGKQLLRTLQRESGEKAEATGSHDRIYDIVGSDQELQDLLLDRSS